MQLLLVRHAIAMDRVQFKNRKSSQKKSDDLRPLTAYGIGRMKKNAKVLKKLVGVPDLIITSPLKRAVQTANILQDTFDKISFEMNEILRPEVAPKEVYSWLNKHVLKKNRLICLIGHEPNLSQLVGRITTGQVLSQIRLKKGGACLLNCATSQIEWLVTPDQLHRMY